MRDVEKEHKEVSVVMKCSIDPNGIWVTKVIINQTPLDSTFVYFTYINFIQKRKNRYIISPAS